MIAASCSKLQNSIRYKPIKQQDHYEKYIQHTVANESIDRNIGSEQQEDDQGRKYKKKKRQGNSRILISDRQGQCLSSDKPITGLVPHVLYMKGKPRPNRQNN